MTDRFSIISLRQLLALILRQLDQKQLFGIPEALFFRPDPNDPFRHFRYDQLLETPIGVAAGPHTQMAQNIVMAWLCGARFIELKTVQTLDELDVSKPCIDMQDEGYNCEWSQELKIHGSFDQYLNAWILIHILKDKLKIGEPGIPGFIFNMSVGYDYSGICQDNVQWFFEKMANATVELEAKLDTIRDLYPRISKLDIPARLSDNITLSTMHGCPPEEIEKIGLYLLEEKKLHTAIKLNPTLLGKKALQEIIQNSGFETIVPDAAFEHDINFEEAVKTITTLSHAATRRDLEFSLKLTNTLECRNHKNVFPKKEEMMYLSGRALHPVSVNVAEKLQRYFRGQLDISFSAGADAFNCPELVACGLYPVTICSDLLKPGGYGRLNQYIEEIRKSFHKKKATSIEAFVIKKNKNEEKDFYRAALANLRRYAKTVQVDPAYQKTNIKDPSIKTSRPLGYFDCVHAPCVDTCPTHQHIPDYLYHTSNGDFKKAAEVILNTNPFPHTTGMVCDHVCQLKCTRINYDSPVLIREVKRFIAEQAINKENGKLPVDPLLPGKPRAGIIGAGPSGLSCASFLVKAGFEVTVFETKPQAGGMVSGAIPRFRLKQEAIQADIHRIEAMGVKIDYTHLIGMSEFEKIRRQNDFVYIATGAQVSRRLKIPGAELQEVLDPIKFLEKIKAGKNVDLGSTVVIIGAGNTAMDAARTAKRLVGPSGKVLIVYRRTKKQMPADVSEIKAVLDEGVEVIDLASPALIEKNDKGKVILVCNRMRLGEPDDSGRPHPVTVPGFEFKILCDSVIPAIGQDLNIDFLPEESLKTQPGSYETHTPNIFIGGDALRGAASIIEAIGDGRKAAQEMIEKAGIHFDTRQQELREKVSLTSHLINRAKREYGIKIKHRLPDERINFELVTKTLGPEEAIAEAARCLLCDELCNICVGVCPNLALYPYQVRPIKIHLKKIVVQQDNSSIKADGRLEIGQEPQILHIADWCNECGNCTTFCPSAGTPYKDKPHFYFDEKAFMAAQAGFFLQQENGKLTLFRKTGRGKESLSHDHNYWIYQTPQARVYLDDRTFNILDYHLPSAKDTEITTRSAAEMTIILQGILSLTGKN